MSKIMRCAIYIRVSSAEQVMHGKSLEAQLRFLTDYAVSKGWKVIGHFADEGKTARKELKRRKAIKELLEHVKCNAVDVILFWKMDRWFRNVADFYKVQDILDAHNCTWVAAAEPSMNLDTREGRLNVNIMLSINQNETDTTSERIKFVNEASVKQGKAIFGNSSLPFGYKVALVDDAKRIVKDESVAHIVNDAFEYYFAHQTKTGTVKYINTKYGNTFTINSMLKMCTHTFYYGSYRENDSYCPAYITKDQWNLMQTINERNIKEHKAQKSCEPFLFPGIFICPLCGRRLSSNKRIRKSGTCARYYRCPNHYSNRMCDYGKVINETTAETYLLENLDRTLDEQRQIYIDMLAEKKKAEKKAPDKTKYQKELDRLNNMYQKGRITEEKYDSEYDRLKSLIDSCQMTENTETRVTKAFCRAEQILVENWQETYCTLPRIARQAFWRNLIEGIDVKEDYGMIKDIHFML